VPAFAQSNICRRTIGHDIRFIEILPIPESLRVIEVRRHITVPGGLLLICVLAALPSTPVAGTGRPVRTNYEPGDELSTSYQIYPQHTSWLVRVTGVEKTDSFA
jgi:hypothetical protein